MPGPLSATETTDLALPAHATNVCFGMMPEEHHLHIIARPWLRDEMAPPARLDAAAEPPRGDFRTLLPG